MELREELLYSKSHEWVKKEGDEALIGLTDYAQSELGDLVFVNLPEEDEEVTAGESFADVESVKAVSDVYSPVTGVVSAVNEELLDAPEMINEFPLRRMVCQSEGYHSGGGASVRRGVRSVCGE